MYTFQRHVPYVLKMSKMNQNASTVVILFMSSVSFDGMKHLTNVPFVVHLRATIQL